MQNFDKSVNPHLTTQNVTLVKRILLGLNMGFEGFEGFVALSYVKL